MLRYKADIRSVLYIVLITALTLYLFFEGFSLPTPLYVGLWIIQMIWYISAGVMVHNHQHVPMWKNKTLNLITNYWLTLLYGYPVFGWIPTHLQNHHIHTNKEEDYTKTYAYSEKNNFWTAIRYPGHSGGVQQKAIIRYMSKLYKKNRREFILQLGEVFILLVYLAIFFAIDWQSALFFILIPQQIALNVVLFFNYFQHIHADENSEYNHSRNFTGWMLNGFLFNNGFHTVHHIKPYMHWSKLPEFHKEIEHKIDPKLNEKTMLGYIVRQYFIAPFVPKLGTKSMRTQKL